MSDYSGLKVVELKEQCKERGIPQTGLSRKQQYIDALEAQDVENDKLGEIPVEGVNTGHVGEESEAGGDVVEESEAGGQQRQGEAAEVNGTQIEDIGNVPVDVQHELPAADAGTNQTPRGGSPAHEEPSSDSRKRKRRSPTPPLRDESVQKKLKAADEEDLPKLADDVQGLPKLAEDVQDGDTQDAAVELPTGGESASSETVPTAQEQLDEVVEDAPVPVEDSDVIMQQAGTSDDAQDFAKTSNADMAMDSEPTAIDEDIGPPSQHTATSALYIRNLLRPLQLHPFREHLEYISTPPGAQSSPDSVISLHLDFYKSHAFAVFSHPSEAVRARKALHNQLYPNETQRKPLWVDFIPSSQVPIWTDTELDAGRTKRFEILYSEAGTATLEEVPSGSQSQPRPSVSSTPQQPQQPNAAPGPGPGMPNAPTGPRSDRRPSQMPPPTTSSTAPPARKPRAEPSTAHLDTLFPSTTSLPKVFYRPASPTLVAKRLDEFARQTSRDWNDGKRAAGGRGGRMTGHLDQLRRYTFEDGDVIVDGGPDFGGFGARQGAGGGGAPGGYMGGGGGGGGRRGGRGGGRGRR